MLVQLSLVFIIVWLLVLRWERRRMIQLASKFGSPNLWQLPVIGHSYVFIGSDEDRMTAFQKLGRKTNNTKEGIISFWQGHKLYLSVSDPKSAEFILKNCLEKDDIMKISRLTTGNGTVFAPVKIWRPRRKVLAPTFSPKNLLEFAKIFSRQSDIMVEQLKPVAHSKDVSIWNFVNTYTLDSVCESTLGVSIHAQKLIEQPLLKSLEQITILDSARMCQPWLYSDTIYKMMPAYKRHTKCRKMIFDFINEVIRAKRNLMQEEKSLLKSESEQAVRQEGVRSFLELLIESSGGDKGYTDLELQEETVVLVVAGTDTSAVGTSFTILLLSKHLDVQEKIYQELQEVFGDSKRPIVPEDLPRLKYLDAVIRESLRLYPPVPVIVRKVENEITLPSGETLVKGTGILVHIWAINRNPKYWGDDADLFRPERFIDTPLKHPAAFISFSYGPRACLGYQYAMMSMKTAMANLLRNYQFLPASNAGTKQPIRLRFDIMMKSVENFTVQIKPRF
ncbi:unnamed protein product [Arctia plantaginis]|uniref:Cytochrome P450 n=1 Tax=Arctia plantaginis TaxID=874455 RepID=A0A8S1BKY4_ARCPL|nr:unnamed protein product [Arctia plantaginis]